MENRSTNLDMEKIQIEEKSFKITEKLREVEEGRERENEDYQTEGTNDGKRELYCTI